MVAARRNRQLRVQLKTFTLAFDPRIEGFDDEGVCGFWVTSLGEGEK